MLFRSIPRKIALGAAASCVVASLMTATALAVDTPTPTPTATATTTTATPTVTATVAPSTTATPAPLALGVTPSTVSPGQTIHVTAAGITGLPVTGTTGCLGILGPGQNVELNISPQFRPKIGTLAIASDGTGQADAQIPTNLVGGSYRVIFGACAPQADMAPLATIAQATITVNGATPTPTVPHDNRYFSQTGFRVDNDTVWDYFNRRGGVNTFGYPVSRTFRLQGFQVQFFQRRIVQLDENGHARLLNVLDSGLMPYTSFNGATFPSIDSGLVASAPDPTNATAVLAFVKAHAPDSFQGMPVNFYQTFLNTVAASVAFPNGGDPGLLPGFDLELWGVPTSGIVVDPNNHNFIYLRFQRGIMHYDAGCSCTQGILLVDYLKSILTGQNLPADLDAEAKTSSFYKQYDSTQPQWVHDPSRLPNTDLTNAFVAQ